MHLCPQELLAVAPWIPFVGPVVARIVRWWTGRQSTLSAHWRKQERQLRHRNEFEGVTWRWPVRKGKSSPDAEKEKP